MDIVNGGAWTCNKTKSPQKQYEKSHVPAIKREWHGRLGRLVEIVLYERPAVQSVSHAPPLEAWLPCRSWGPWRASLEQEGIYVGAPYVHCDTEARKGLNTFGIWACCSMNV